MGQVKKPNLMTIRYLIKITIVNIIILIVLLASTAVFGGYWLTSLLSNPAKADNIVLKKLARNFYQERRNIIQFLPDCSQYDPGLTYTLKPGMCTFTNAEYSIEVHINSQGLRDDEGSLDKPEMIVLGDSHALGWGVNQDETFASIVETRTGLKVLNAGISSYGTVREMMLLSRLDTSNLQYLVIQYNANDRDENRYFYNNKKLNILSEEAYLAEVSRHVSSRSSGFVDNVLYVKEYMIYKLTKPFKKLMKHIREATNLHFPRAAYAEDGSKEKVPDEADLFFYALLSSTVDLKEVHIIFVETNGYNSNNSELVQALTRKLDEGIYKPDAKKISILDVAPVMSEEDFFLLDGHTNRNGHRKVADLIINTIG